MKKNTPETNRHHIVYLEKRDKERINKLRRAARATIRGDELYNYRKGILKFFGATGFKDDHDHNTAIGHRYFITIPKIFSLIDNPDETLEILEQIVRAARDTKIKELLIDHSNCEEVEIGASSVMDVIIMAARKRWRKKKVELHGLYPHNEQVKEILKVSGIIKHIKHPDSHLPTSIMSRHIPYDLVMGRKDKPLATRSTSPEIVTTNLTLYVDKILYTQGYRLNPDGLNQLSRLISEVLDNAEQHSNRDEWFVIGHMGQISEDKGICYISIFDFGNSIYKSISEADLNPDIRDKINNLIGKHTKKGLFQFKDKWSPENLWTLFALQEGISRFNVKNIKDRGHGTVNMIEFFLKLGKSVDSDLPPKMALISDKTYILFDGKYKIENIKIGDERRQVIAFNEANSLEEIPDGNYIKNLKNRFPGTIITMKFYIDKKYLVEQMLNGVENGIANN